MEIINRYSNVISISKKTKLNPKFFSRKTFIFYQRKNNKVEKKWSIRLTDRDTFSMWSQRGSRCYQEIVFLAISSLPPPTRQESQNESLYALCRTWTSIRPSVRRSIVPASVTRNLQRPLPGWYSLSCRSTTSVPLRAAFKIYFVASTAPTTRLLYLLGIPFLQNDLLGSCERP